VNERFKYSEARLADSLGVTRQDLRPIRQRLLREGRDWKKIHGQVLFSEGSTLYIAKAFGVESPNLEALLVPLEEDPPPAIVESNGYKKMRVIPPKPLNPRVIYAQDEAGNKSLVWVGRNDTFCFDDEIEVKPHETQTGILECVSEIPRDRRRVHRM
jgi:hypothetical protein